MPYDEEAFGEPLCVLPFLAVAQTHKVTTPVRPCLDYRHLNDRLLSHPGKEAPACNEALRKWRLQPDDNVLLDLKKAYLQIRVAPSLVRYQAVVWKGKLYEMTRMGFGLNVAPKILDMVVKWVTRDLEGVDSYVDDLNVPKCQQTTTLQQLERYGLQAKPAVDISTTRVLGLQLSKQHDGTVLWACRSDQSMSLPEQPTRRQVYSWCGRLVGHYPVVGWLRPACNFIKRQLGADLMWDQPVPPSVAALCSDLAERRASGAERPSAWRVAC